MGPATGGYNGRASQRVVGAAEQAELVPVQEERSAVAKALKPQVPVAEAPPLAIDPRLWLELAPRSLRASPPPAAAAAAAAPGCSRHS